MPSKLSRIWSMTPVRPNRFRGLETIPRVAQEVTREVVLRRVHPDDSCPEDSGTNRLALKGQPWHRPFWDRQVLIPRVRRPHRRHFRSGIDHEEHRLPLALIGLELQSQLGRTTTSPVDCNVL